MSNPIKIEIPHLESTITIEGTDYLLCPKAQLEKLLADNIDFKSRDKAHQEEITLLKGAVLNIMKVLGLIDEQTSKLKAGLETGEESYMKHILKSLTSVVSMLTFGQTKKLQEKFHFISEIMPLVKKYAGTGK